MACSLKIGIFLSESTQSKAIQNLALSHCFGYLQFSDPKSKNFPVLRCNFLGQSLVVPGQSSLATCKFKSPNNFFVHAQSSIRVSGTLRWWEKTMKSNMVKISSAQEFVDSLKNAGDKLVIVDFYSPGCGGCRALHPKICQLAESNPDAIFFKINYEELKPMCHALHIRVLPFFRFYRGAEGRLCSFSCTVATIKKFKDALARYSTERCSLGSAKGLDESELLKLASIGEISENSPSTSLSEDEKSEGLVMKSFEISSPLGRTVDKSEAKEEENAVLVA
ncbi:hypothetical protein Nepgr_023772 [Nepenthes gracilis]|uniref:Thioredoxin domain-containing protein n=1 Tax=Nepenthes gracilis TaxID=150966 RepID=A0AAD3XZE2_NEPGR|nr:hypothetical protein Nepgr_023772 [Nepenthes gracilis]